MTTYQEILEAITRHRAEPVRFSAGMVIDTDLARKVNEIEWALQILTEKLRDEEEERGELHV